MTWTDTKDNDYQPPLKRGKSAVCGFLIKVAGPWNGEWEWWIMSDPDCNLIAHGTIGKDGEEASFEAVKATAVGWLRDYANRQIANAEQLLGSLECDE